MRHLILLLGAAALGCGGGTKPTTLTQDHVHTGLPETDMGHDMAGHDMASPTHALAWADGAALIDGLGDLHRAVTTTSPEAQKYFDQGLRLDFGFNHDEATRSFAKAAQLDPSCAMCWWGIALTLGPNYNVPMLPDRAQAAWEALTRAEDLAAAKAPAVEAALIGALAKRYKGPEPLDPPAMQPFNEAYAAAMRDVALQFPDDDDVQVLFAEAMMDKNPWHLWDAAGKPAAGTEEIVTTLKAVIARDVKHVGANHYLIHAVEASPHPEEGLESADRLAALMPAAGHIVHMPAHIYQRVGRYADASAANHAAIAADQAYMAKLKPPGYYPMYLAHNYGFLAFSASMLGRSEEALTASREAAKAIPEGMIDMMPGMDFFVAEPIMVMVRFGKWKELLAEPRPKAAYQIWTGLWLHGHGLASVATGKLDDAAADLKELTALAAAVKPEVTAGQTPGPTLLQMAASVLEASLLSAKKDPTALDHWKAAVATEDSLAYDEPADWFYPTRHWYGAALLAAGKAKDAEAVFREDLRRNPANGWSYYGLELALKKQKKSRDAAAADKQFHTAWPDPDIKLTTSIVP